MFARRCVWVRPPPSATVCLADSIYGCTWGELAKKVLRSLFLRLVLQPALGELSLFCFIELRPFALCVAGARVLQPVSIPCVVFFGRRTTLELTTCILRMQHFRRVAGVVVHTSHW